MLRQSRYIFYAVLLLISGACSFLFIKNIPFATTNQNNGFFCATENRVEKSLSENGAKGKYLFTKMCASCHAINKDLTGPGLLNFTDRGPWSNRKKLYEWIRNPEAFMKKNEYARSLAAVYNGSMMMGFPDITTSEIDAIADYLTNSW